MKLTLNKAAQTCSRSKSTILEAIRSGRLTAPKDDKGRYAIDPAELSRVFPFRASDQSDNRSPTPVPTYLENHQNSEALEREVELLREMLTKAEANSDHWRKMAERQQILLENKQPKKLWTWAWFNRNQ